MADDDGRWIVVDGRRWRATDPSIPAQRVRSAMAALARKRAPATTCPSDAARAVGGERWRALMDAARDGAVALADEGQVELRQRGEPIDHRHGWRGPVRVAWVGDDPAG